jgi:hypothetical protein
VEVPQWNVVGANFHSVLRALEMVSPSLQGFNYGQHFLLMYGVILLSCIQLTTQVRNRLQTVAEVLL